MQLSETRHALAPGHTDILGQQTACQQLWGALGDDRLHHCYLFEGPAGVGKATVALRLAMAANCQERGREGPLPCNRCRSCRDIAAERHPDVVALNPDPEKAGGVITVAQAREVVRRMTLHRHSARRRFVIVDPADKLREEAANALLKTLEEPPPGSGFVLVTSRAASLLPTVLSRSLRVRFRPVPREPLVAWLKARGLEQPERLARMSLGSPGASLQLAEGGLERLLRSREELIAAISADPAAIFDYAQALSAPPRTAWEERVSSCLDALEISLRDAACYATGRQQDLLDPERSELAQRWAQRLWPGGLRRVDEALDLARQRLAVNVSPRLVMESLLACLAAELR